ncbi:MAG: hypothetical protein U1C66_02515, partial [Patescibacteria group bacterium]|nr:hypothetical protein [Patescibacteria group bacterium]
MDVLKNLDDSKREKLQRVLAVAGGLALLIGIALLTNNLGLWRDLGLVAAVDCSSSNGGNPCEQDTIGPATIEILADASPIEPGESTNITWSATGVSDIGGGTACFGNGSTCGTPLQSISQSPNYPNTVMPLEIGSDSYLVVTSAN